MGSFPEPPRRDRVRSIFSGRHPWKLELGRRTLLMGVLNLTPDSFYTASRCAGTDEALESAIRLQDAGADIVDVGGESTRPGSGGVSEEEETARVIPVIERLSRALSVPISVDTSKAGVARRALAAGAWMINDVSALTADPEMAEVAAGGGGPVVLMHMRGTPETMQAAPSYGDVVAEVGEFL
ncbi:MAG TPA: dihydropteroate synthase, partial [bacterium]|nr:dihydropteroate synthase [bacterium]